MYSVPVCEHSWSVEGWIQSKRRNRLSQELVERILRVLTNLVLRETLDVVLHHLLPWDIEMRNRWPDVTSSLSPQKKTVVLTVLELCLSIMSPSLNSVWLRRILVLKLNSRTDGNVLKSILCNRVRSWNKNQIKSFSFPLPTTFYPVIIFLVLIFSGLILQTDRYGGGCLLFRDFRPLVTCSPLPVEQPPPLSNSDLLRIPHKKTHHDMSVGVMGV
jgi:hypothetical protein